MENNWRKSSHSGSNGGECVEVASADGLVLVRDTIEQSGPTLIVTAEAWSAFISAVK